MLEYDDETLCLALTCDTCGEYAVFEGRYNECIKDAKTDGWCLYNFGDEREHYCINCCRIEI